MKKLRYGILGCGMMGKEHIRNLALIQGAEVVAIADPDATMQSANQALAPAARLCTSLEQLLAVDDLDAVLIASPNYQHADQLLTVLAQCDLPILVEKPICTEFADVQRLAEAFAAHPAPVWVAMEYRYMPPVQLFREKLNEGVTGKLQMLSIIEHRFPFLEKVDDWNRFNRYSGGTLVEKCCHYFDLMRLLIPSTPCRVYASGAANHNHQDEQYGGQVPDIVDNAYAIVDFTGGQRAMLELCMFAEGSRYQESLVALGPAAKVQCDIPGPTRFWPAELGPAPEPRVTVSPRHPAGPVEIPVPVPAELLEAGDHNGSTYFQHAGFYKAVRAHRGESIDDVFLAELNTAGSSELSERSDGSALADASMKLNQGVDVSVLDGLRAVVLGMAAQHSMATGHAIEIAPDGLNFTRRD